MGKWVGGGWSWWPGAGSSWTFSPYIQGDDNPNLPPPKVAEKATRGPAYYSTSDGHRYRTWQVPSPNGRTTQIIVDWREKIDLTGGDPASIEISKGQ